LLPDAANVNPVRSAEKPLKYLLYCYIRLYYFKKKPLCFVLP